MIKTETRLIGDLEKQIETFSEEVKEGVLRAGVQAAAEMFYVEAKLRAPVSDAPHMFKGTTRTYGPYSPGNLRDAIYQVYSQDRSEKGAPVYHVSWNNKKVPYGYMVEFGTSKMPAHPFMRPAYEAMRTIAGDRAMEKMSVKMNGVSIK